MTHDTPKMTPVRTARPPKKERQRTAQVKMIRASSEDLKQKVDPDAPTLLEVRFDIAAIAAAAHEPPDPNATPDYPTTPMVKALEPRKRPDADE